MRENLSKEVEWEDRQMQRAENRVNRIENHKTCICILEIIEKAKKKIQHLESRKKNSAYSRTINWYNKQIEITLSAIVRLQERYNKQLKKITNV